jgi:hypothetical protein
MRTLRLSVGIGTKTEGTTVSTRNFTDIYFIDLKQLLEKLLVAFANGSLVLLLYPFLMGPSMPFLLSCFLYILFVIFFPPPLLLFLPAV